MKKHFSEPGWKGAVKATVCGISVGKNDCTYDRDQVTCKNCTRVIASWFKALRR